MQSTTDNIFILVALGMAGTFLLVVSFILFSIRNQNRLLKQRQQFQQAQITHQKELLKAVIESQEAERKRIGQDLHDDVGTTISGLRLLIEMFKPSSGDDKNYQNFAQSTKTIIDKIVKDVRNISHNLSPTTLSYYGLAAAVNEHCTIINQSGKLEITLNNNAEKFLENLPITTSTAIYRVMEELLNNTIKHSGASKAGIDFKVDAGLIMIAYTDNGKGLPADIETAKKGMGMQNIESRLLNINATYKLEPYAGKGFQIKIECPIVNA
ncbi:MULTISPECIES: histidine kinase [unclassified Mucilaginibacter]|uniref:sensor histidine kinase n=1 Tax=unclassified Mucilaginibacter TaxID=2617802 RepID=UPI002AC9D9BF|nr:MULTISPECIES: histidine kinase [unclassified Mucilaginibacter]MEB0263901.1 histidine kinase [Mucilaginibacter sp. 10I4]MEB0279319.1 histidine kinase [Mucilaginibacter sp. 10B2]MEB0302896.1 histidine kinase [Mucilaginibacter sp. 5C4]WPX23169.1 histidine kinase [Mucilaginibacter sp. 5C4]